MINLINKNIKKKRRKRIRTIVLLLFVALLAFTVWGNYHISVTEITLENDDIPVAFMGFRIVQLSDLHNIEFGEGNKRLVDKVENCEPDIIVITGDIIDMFNTDFEIALELVKELVKICPVYYVNGNHEGSLDNYFSFENDLIREGVFVLADYGMVIERHGVRMNIIGVDDPTIYRSGTGTMNSVVDQYSGENDYNVLLSHRPELFDEYVSMGVDLVFAGHSHGGQFRLPFIGGLYAPNQGLFPEYDGGIYSKNGTNMIVSRGLGNSVIPFRFNNTPEIVVVELLPIVEKGEIINGS